MPNNSKKISGKKKLSHYFPEREIHLRSNGKVRFYKLTPRLQSIATFVFLLIISWTVFSTWSFNTLSTLILNKDRHISNARLAYHSLLGDIAEYQKKFTAITKDLENNHVLMLGLVKKNDSLQYRLNNVSKKLVVTETNRETEQKARETLKGNLSEIESQLRVVAERNFSLEDNLTMVEKNLQKVDKKSKI